VYDPATNTWSTRAPLPSPRHSLTAVGIGGKLYAVGGRDASGNYTNTVFVYDPVVNTWSNGSAAMPTARAGLGVAAIDRVLYEVGGNNSNTSVLAANEAFTP
jgi:N-acetylneuraminic acid mutarotase